MSAHSSNCVVFTADVDGKIEQTIPYLLRRATEVCFDGFGCFGVKGENRLLTQGSQS